MPLKTCWVGKIGGLNPSSLTRPTHDTVKVELPKPVDGS